MEVIKSTSDNSDVVLEKRAVALFLHFLKEVFTGLVSIELF